MGLGEWGCCFSEENISFLTRAEPDICYAK